jgi:hypothetical protein
MRSSRDDPQDRYETAIPVWYMVTPVVAVHYLIGWKVVRKDICPQCGGPVSPEDIATSADIRGPWDIPHSSCRETWEKTGWQFPDSKERKGSDQKPTPSPGGKR